jgi:hypothetical protein
VAIVELGGVTNVGHNLEVLGPRGAGIHITGLYDDQRRQPYAVD